MINLILKQIFLSQLQGQMRGIKSGSEGKDAPPTYSFLFTEKLFNVFALNFFTSRKFCFQTYSEILISY